MNGRFVPDGQASPTHDPARPAGRSAMVTPSFSLDFERCRLLCETVDAHVSGMEHHYLLVEHRDVKQFRQLESARRTVVDERDLLPSWLHVFDDSFGSRRRRIWLSLRTLPLRGWHVQQLRRIAIASKVDVDTLVYCDSDVVFLKPFDLGAFHSPQGTRLFRRDDALLDERYATHRIWSRNAGRSLGIADVGGSAHDYITTLIAWDRATVVAMAAHIEDVHARNWVEVIGGSRRYSECIIYGRFVDEVLGGAGHWHDSREFCRVHWTGDPLTDEAFEAFVAGMEPSQVAIGMQSFIGTDMARIRRLAKAA